jgi:diaminopropionate ammonia-lyase
VKVEADRFGLPAFKVLGVIWATYQALVARCLDEPLQRPSLEALRPALDRGQVTTLVAATAGNHGRALAWMARLLAIRACILVPATTPRHRIEAIRSDGGDVIVVDGSYDEAVRAAAERVRRDDRSLLVADTAWPGYTAIPGWTVDGYATLFEELDEQLRAAGGTVTAAVVQIGVGSLATAACRWAAARHPCPTLIGVECLDAASMLRTARAGRAVEVGGPHTSRMVGMAAGNPSAAAWPVVTRWFDAFVAVSDERVDEAVRHLELAGIAAGDTGAAGLVALLELHAAGPDRLRAAGLNLEDSVLLLCTEGRGDGEPGR